MGAAMSSGGGHESFDKHDALRLPSERSFGLTFAVVFSLLAAFTYWHSGITWKLYACLAVVASFGSLGFIAPVVLRPFNYMWMKFGLALHKVVNPVIMGLLFFGVFTPMGVIMRAFGVDLLQMRRKSASPDSYWVVRSEENLPNSSMKNQF
jgi:hypothetical protein